MGLYQQVLMHHIGGDILASLEGFEKVFKQYEVLSGEVVASDTKMGVIVRAMA